MPNIAVFTVPDDANGAFVEVLDNLTSLPDGNYAIVARHKEMRFVVADAQPDLVDDSSVPLAVGIPHPFNISGGNAPYLRGRPGTQADLVA